MFRSQNASPDVVKVLVGNKCEVVGIQRAVTADRGQKVFVSFSSIIPTILCF